MRKPPKILEMASIEDVGYEQIGELLVPFVQPSLPSSVSRPYITRRTDLRTLLKWPSWKNLYENLGESINRVWEHIFEWEALVTLPELNKLPDCEIVPSGGNLAWLEQITYVAHSVGGKLIKESALLVYLKVPAREGFLYIDLKYQDLSSLNLEKSGLRLEFPVGTDIIEQQARKFKEAGEKLELIQRILT